MKILFLCAVLASPLGLAAQVDSAASVASLPEAPSAQIAQERATVVQMASAQAEDEPWAQSSSAPQDATAAQQPVDKRSQADREVQAQEKQRMLGIMPAFNLVTTGQAAPIGPKQKFHLWIHSAVDPFQFGIAGLDAGIEQAQNTYPEWHQGALGFTKRYAAAYGDNVDGNLWGNAVLPSLLHQDPRYYRLGHGSPGKRIWYSFTTAFRCKSDSGKWQPNYSNVLGNIIGGGISNLYYPASDRGVGLTFERGITVTLEGTLGAIAEEFYPDFATWRQHVKERKAAAARAASHP